MEVAAARGIWSAESSNPEDHSPYVFYRVWLQTDGKHLATDLRKFRRFVSQIEVLPLE
jgi:hypothetical protein